MLNLDKNKTYLLACSFGPDSMALFDMLIKEGYSFEIAHVNYHLRKEAKDETENLVAYCKTNNIECHVLQYCDWPNKSNLEAKCREIRYKFFSDLFKAGDFKSVLVAHNQDDLIETYYLQKQRKSLVSHYGLKDKTIINGTPIERPLLSWKKTDLEKYCDENNVPYSIDSSNLEDCYQRNVIRHKIVSKLSNKERCSIISKIDEENKNLNDFIKQLADIDLTVADQLLSFEGNELCYALNELCHQSFPTYSLSKNLCAQIKSALLSSRSNIEMKIKRDLYFIKTYDRCYFDIKKDIEYCFKFDKPVEFCNEYFYVNLLSDTTNLHVTKDDYPLTIRTIKKTDKYIINGYVTKANRLMIDWKMPLNFRKRWPCILNKDGIVIYIPRYRPNFKPKEGLNFLVK